MSRKVHERRRRNALNIAHATIRVLEFEDVMRDLHRAQTTVVVLGFLSDIAGLLIMKNEGHRHGPRFTPLAVKEEEWSYALNKDFISCAVGEGLAHVDRDLPVVLISTSRNLLRAHTLREKVRVTHCELAWLKALQDQGRGQFKWQTFETDVRKNEKRIPLFISLLRRM